MGAIGIEEKTIACFHSDLPVVQVDAQLARQNEDVFVNPLLVRGEGARAPAGPEFIMDDVDPTPWKNGRKSTADEATCAVVKDRLRIGGQIYDAVYVVFAQQV